MITSCLAGPDNVQLQSIFYQFLKRYSPLLTDGRPPQDPTTAPRQVPSPASASASGQAEGEEEQRQRPLHHLPRQGGRQAQQAQSGGPPGLQELTAAVLGQLPGILWLRQALASSLQHQVRLRLIIYFIDLLTSQGQEGFCLLQQAGPCGRGD